MSASGATIQRPFSDYRNSQAGYFFFWIANGPGSSSVLPNCTSQGNYAAGYVDYLGFENDRIIADGFPSLGTTVTGTVTQSDNGDGTSTVKVNFDTTNAIATANCENLGSFTNPETQEPLDLGYTRDEIEAGSQPALATSHFSVVFTIQGTGPAAPIPNFDFSFVPNCPAPAPCLQSIKFQATATGSLRQPFGVADGTPGTMSIAQTNTNHTTGRAGRPGPFAGLTAAAVIVQRAK